MRGFLEDIDSSTGLLSVNTHHRGYYKGILNDVEVRQLFISGTATSRRQFGIDAYDWYKWGRIPSNGPDSEKNETWKDAWNVYPPRAAVVYCEMFSGDVLFISAETMYYYMFDVDMFYTLGLNDRLKSVEFVGALHCVNGVYWPVCDAHRYTVFPHLIGSKDNLERFFSHYLNQGVFKYREKLLNHIPYRKFLRDMFMDIGRGDKVTVPFMVTPIDYRPGIILSCRDNMFPLQKFMYKGKAYIDQFDISDTNPDYPVVIQTYGTVSSMNIIDRKYFGKPRKFVLECTNPPNNLIFNIPPHPNNEGYMLDLTIRCVGKTPPVTYLRECIFEFRNVYIDDNHYGNVEYLCRRGLSRICFEGNGCFPIGLTIIGPMIRENGKLSFRRNICNFNNSEYRKHKFPEKMEAMVSYNRGWEGCVVDWFGDKFCLKKN